MLRTNHVKYDRQAWGLLPELYPRHGPCLTGSSCMANVWLSLTEEVTEPTMLVHATGAVRYRESCLFAVFLDSLSSTLFSIVLWWSDSHLQCLIPFGILMDLEDLTRKVLPDSRAGVADWEVIFPGGTAMEAEYFLQESEGPSQGQHEAVVSKNFGL